MNVVPVSACADGRCREPGSIIDVALAHGLRPATDAEIRSGWASAANLIPGAIASADAFIALQHAWPASVFRFVEYGAMTGFLSAFPVRPEGAKALFAGTFDTLNVNESLVCRPGEIPRAYYGWGFAATTQAGGRAVVKGSLDIHRKLYWNTPTFARAVTPDGRRALSSIGFRPFGDDPEMFWIPEASFAPEENS